MKVHSRPGFIDPQNVSGSAIDLNPGTYPLPLRTISELIRLGFHRKGFRLRTLREGVMRMAYLGLKDE
jgi:hypothetical protein